ncbi:hypothetical protein [Rhodococcus pyridinivorans]|uniref:RecT-like ssDNA binding protein n=1 Tax=Rhodococcus pyridinivorans AK37 TaxID=1114960 RepID=H0JL72_9NOCA|nr:hypothetical protein [Rhodococcus pyridinivorans]EHK86407.1 hypothetical protein AK37_01627 [Rhodococcus pyridinivorans AK37]MCD2139502.1 hypothetical protein [Rhodococcus pyridinivorans]
MTTNDIAPLDEADIVPSGGSFVATTESSKAIDTLMSHAKAMDIAYKLAEGMCKTALVPSIYRGKPADGTAAILYGAELGLNPIQSLQQIFVVHGTPAIYARTMVALLKVKGYHIWTEESTDESVTVCGQAPSGISESSTWDIERATKAGYVPTVDEKTGKFKTNENGKLIGNEKYLKDPQAMLYAKAASEVCRKLAPDVLLGIAHTREDLELDPPEEATVQRSAPKQRGVAGARAALGIASKQVAEPEPAQASEPATAEKAPPAATAADLKRLDAALTEAGITDIGERRTFLSARAGRELKAARELTRDEVASIIRFVKSGEEQVSGGEQS